MKPDYEKLWKDLKVELEDAAQDRFWNLSTGDERLDSQKGMGSAQKILDRMNQAEILGNR